MSIISPLRSDEQIEAEVRHVQSVFKNHFKIELHPDSFAEVITAILEKKIHDYITARFTDWQPQDLAKIIVSVPSLFKGTTTTQSDEQTEKKHRVRKQKPVESMN